MAVAVCDHLIRFVNREVAVANEMATEITQATDPAARRARLLVGWDRVISEARAHLQRTAALQLPVSRDATALWGELQLGAAAAVVTLEARRADLEAFGAFEESSEPGVIGTAFTGIEKAFSLVEPAVFRYEHRALREAFDEEPTCAHVVQWTGT